MNESQDSMLTPAVICPSCGHSEKVPREHKASALKFSRCEAPIPISTGNVGVKPRSVATRWSFITLGIVCLIASVIVVVVVVFFLILVASGGAGLFLAPLFAGLFKVLAFVLPCILLIASGIPSLIAFAREEPRRYISLIVPVISIALIAFFTSLGAGIAKPNTQVDGDPTGKFAESENFRDTPAGKANQRYADPPEWALYDLEADPVEFVNLADQDCSRRSTVSATGGTRFVAGGD